MNTVLFVNSTISFSKNLFLIFIQFDILVPNYSEGGFLKNYYRKQSKF